MGSFPWDSQSPTSPAAPAPSDHGPHFFAPWTNVTCQAGGGCPASGTPEPLSCGNWFGASVAALACDQGEMRRALNKRALDRRGGFTIRLINQDREAATAPGLAQVLGRPLVANERAVISGAVPAGTQLQVRARYGRHLFTAVFENEGPLSGVATVTVRLGAHRQLTIILQHGHETQRPTLVLRQLLPASHPRRQLAGHATTGAEPAHRNRVRRSSSDSRDPCLRAWLAATPLRTRSTRRRLQLTMGMERTCASAGP
jgi:hypothetical protein